jgi:hypothetical protein
LSKFFSIKDQELLDPNAGGWEEMQVKRGDFVFFSLVREKLNLVCDLDILFLRRDDPGKLIGGGGDLDNRIEGSI